MKKIKYVILMIIGVFSTLALSLFLAAYFTGSIKISGKNSYVAEARRAIKNGDDKQGKLSYIDGIKFSYSDELVRELAKFESENLVEEELNKVKKLIEEKNYIEAISILDRLKIREKTSTLKKEIDLAIETCREEIAKEKIKEIENDISKNNFEKANSSLEFLIKNDYDKNKIIKIRDSYEKAYKLYNEKQKKIAEEKRKKEVEKKKKEELEEECNPTEEEIELVARVHAREKAIKAFPNMKLIRDGVINNDIYDEQHEEILQCYNFLFQEKNGKEKYVVFIFIDGCIKARHATGP